MIIKALLIDFDETVVNKDILDVICAIVGKEKESQRLNDEFIAGKREGLCTLITRINFLKGVSVSAIEERLNAQNYLAKGAHELFKYLHAKKVTSILHSGNIVPILLYYKSILGVDYVVGTKPKMNGDSIDSISIDDFPEKSFKVMGCANILRQLGITSGEVVAIGDSIADREIFEYAAKAIAVNPKGGIERYADYVIDNDLTKVINIIEFLLHDSPS